MNPQMPTDPQASATPLQQPSNPQAAAPQQPTAPQAAAAAPAWSQYVGHIVRWEDGTSWQVQADGRHWIPDGGVYQSLTQKGAQVFNLSAAELDAIPDIKGSHATA